MCLFYHERRRQLVWFTPVPHKSQREREEKREKERKKEAQDRIKSPSLSTLSSSLITIHFSDYINERQKKMRPRKCGQMARMENNDVTGRVKKDKTFFLIMFDCWKEMHQMIASVSLYLLSFLFHIEQTWSEYVIIQDSSQHQKLFLSIFIVQIVRRRYKNK
jgi:hypothetical protein